ncbi:hypothetical protein [Poseidonocella sp. HB161398]|uniref:hypothetical protein n=1 Tax=Poseidonocella sp. HB161398 TaxID=2320855 RepID=UPI001108A782|nr:hypothetical protein [Poseidonocella sp. HB161398]
MTRQTRSILEASELATVPSEAIASGIETIRKMSETWSAMHSNGLSRMLKRNEEALGFASRRLEDDRRLLDQLSEQSDPASAFRIWNGFLLAMFRDYSEECQRQMMRFGEDFRQAGTTMQDRIRMAAEDIVMTPEPRPETRGNSKEGKLEAGAA